MTKPQTTADKALYRDLGSLTKRKEDWQTNIDYVVSLLEGQSVVISVKALWLLGEMGLRYPDDIVSHVAKIASFLDSPDDLLRERAVNALGRIGRTRIETVMPYWDKMLNLSSDSSPRVRLSLIWASENIATHTPEAYDTHIPLYAQLLHDEDDRVRMEAPEMFRVLGKRRPHQLVSYIAALQHLATNDPHPVVRIHSAGAINAINKALENDANAT